MSCQTKSFKLSMCICVWIFLKKLCFKSFPFSLRLLTFDLGYMKNLCFSFLLLFFEERWRWRTSTFSSSHSHLEYVHFSWNSMRNLLVKSIYMKCKDEKKWLPGIFLLRFSFYFHPTNLVLWTVCEDGWVVFVNEEWKNGGDRWYWHKSSM
jgi:hypothetical protein